MKGNTLNDLVGLRIGKVRQANNETQKDLQKYLGVNNRVSVTQWENGKRQIGIDNLKAIAEHYRVSTDYLLGILPEGVTSISGDKRIAQEYSGLSNDAIANIRRIKEDCKPEVIDVLNALLSDRGLREILVSIQAAAYIHQIPNLPEVPKEKPFSKEPDTTFQVEEDEEGNRFITVRVDYLSAREVYKQRAIESFGQSINRIVGEDGK